MFESQLIVVRGGGDLATGVIYRLRQAGMRVVVLELARPRMVRRPVSVADAVYEGTVIVEGMPALRVEGGAAALAACARGDVPVLVSPTLPPDLQPTIVIDARIAKRNIDTALNDAPLVIALGPGFEAGVDCDVVIETMRGHRLGRVITHGKAIPDTGTPGIVAGKGAERVLRAPVAGAVAWQVAIGERVTGGQTLGSVADAPVLAPFAGVVRGLIAPALHVPANYKIGDVDARGDIDACFTISDKALAIGGGVLAAILGWMQTQ